MSQFQRLEDLEEQLRPIVEGAGLDLDSVVAVNQSGTPVIRVTVDVAGPGSRVDSDALADVSRVVSKTLDVIDPVDGEYLLEVSTPGAERQLTEPRHWTQQIGRLAKVKLRDGSTLIGRVEAADEESATLRVGDETATIAYTQMKKARARVEFGSEE